MTTALDLLRELRAREGTCESPPAADPRSPFAQVQREWRAAWARARASFVPDVEPGPEALEAAARLELDLAAPTWPRPFVSREEARALLQAVYRGELAARVGSDSRVRIGSPRAAGPHP